jgi:BioD-like phosphotransacetylase family protein
MLRSLPCPVLIAARDSYAVAASVQNVTVKTGPGDTQKIGLIQQIIADHVNLDRILAKL